MPSSSKLGNKLCNGNLVRFLKNVSNSFVLKLRYLILTLPVSLEKQTNFDDLTRQLYRWLRLLDPTAQTSGAINIP
jgi:hypothetical protein